LGTPFRRTFFFEGVHSLFLLPPFVENLSTAAKLVIDAAKAAGVKYVVKLSALIADSKSSLHAPAQHGSSDEYLKSSGIPFAILQPTFFSSNLLWQAGSIATQGVFYGSAGAGQTTFISPRDLASVAVHLLASPEKHQNQVYPITGSQLLSSEEVAATIGLVLQKPIKYVDLAPEAHKSLLEKFGTPSWQASDLVGFEQAKKNDWIAEVNANVKKITGKWPQSFRGWVEENKAAFILSVPSLSDAAKKAAGGKFAVVAGGNRGIGLSVVKALAKLGLEVLLTARDEKAGAELVAGLRKEGLNVKFHALDIASEASVAKLKDYLEKEHKGKIDILINNGAINLDSKKDDFFQTSPAAVSKSLETNTVGTLRVIQAVVELLKTHSAGSAGRIINVSSTRGLLSFQQGPLFSYSLSKLAVNGTTLAAASATQRDEKTKNIHIVAMCPGPVDTDMLTGAGFTREDFEKRELTLRTPDLAAEDIVELALADDGAVLNGKFFRFGKEMGYISS